PKHVIAIRKAVKTNRREEMREKEKEGIGGRTNTRSVPNMPRRSVSLLTLMLLPRTLASRHWHHSTPLFCPICDSFSGKTTPRPLPYNFYCNPQHLAAWVAYSTLQFHKQQFFRPKPIFESHTLLREGVYRSPLGRE
ncbi:unnamed protein product, partial [Pylaiella littoralis]